jgi:hypothetical protein
VIQKMGCQQCITVCTPPGDRSQKQTAMRRRVLAVQRVGKLRCPLLDFTFYTFHIRLHIELRLGPHMGSVETQMSRDPQYAWGCDIDVHAPAKKVAKHEDSPQQHLSTQQHPFTLRHFEYEFIDDDVRRKQYHLHF